MKVFLGGTCNGSTWREYIIPKLTIDYFNPVVEDWTIGCRVEEVKQRRICDYCLYVITPLMEGVYSIAELVDDSNKRPEKTIFCLLKEYDNKTFTKSQRKSLENVAKLIIKNGSRFFSNLDRAVKFLNNIKEG